MDRIPSASYVRLKQGPALAAVFEKLVFNGAYYLYLNCEMEPFNGPNGRKVRQAFCYAINKDRIVQIGNDRYVAAKGVVPPQHAGLQVPGGRIFLRSGKGERTAGGGGLSRTACRTVDPLDVQRKQRRRAHRGGDPAGPQGESASRTWKSTPVNFDVLQPAVGKTPTPSPSPFPAGIQDYPDPSDFLDQLFSSHVHHRCGVQQHGLLQQRQGRRA